MQCFGVAPQSRNELSYFRFQGCQYRGCEMEIEPDASAASYFWALAAIHGGAATVEGLNANSLQGDTKFVRCLEQMGCCVEFEKDHITVRGPATRGIDIDMEDISDTAQTLAVVALFVEGPTRIRGIAHNRVKETDRIGNVAKELRKLGANVEEHEDGMTIVPGAFRSALIETYNDHRMAMSFAVAGTKNSGVVIRDPGCVSKTFPAFFEVLNRCLEK